MAFLVMLRIIMAWVLIMICFDVFVGFSISCALGLLGSIYKAFREVKYVM